MPRFIFPGRSFSTTTSVGSMMYSNSNTSSRISRQSTETVATSSSSILLSSDDESDHTVSSTTIITSEIPVKDRNKSPGSKEEIQVLVDSNNKEEEQKETPLPKFQLFLLSIVLVCEPITASILFPFIYFMLRDLHVSDDEKEIGTYAGWITSMFFVAQLLTSIMWGKLSDRFGRRPVLLIGLLGNTICSCLFGLSKSLIWAVSSRTLCGIMNGNLGVARTAVTEITDETNRTKAFSLFGLCYGLGLIGPVLGGFLCNPVQQFPTLFGNCQFLKNYPYFLPCSAAASISIIGLIVSYFFLRESSPYVLVNDSSHDHYPCSEISEATPLLNKQRCKTKLQKSSGSLKDVPKAAYVAIIGFMVFTFHTLLFDEVLPLYFTAPSYAGGLSMTTQEFAQILTIFGAVQLVYLSFIYPRIAKYLDTLVLCRLACILLVIAYTLFPELTFVKQWSSAINATASELPSSFFRLSYATLLAIRFIAHITIHTAFSIIVSISAPPELTGVVNGVVSSALSFGRAISPTFGGSVWSFSLQNGQVYPFDHHLVYYIIAGLALFNVIHTYFIPTSLALGGRRHQK